MHINPAIDKDTESQTAPQKTFWILTLVFSLVATGLMFGAVLNDNVAVALVALPLVIAVGFIVYRHPIWVLYIFIVALPLHFLFLVMLYGQIGLSANIIRFVASWKEALLVGTFTIVLTAALVKSRTPIPTWVDIVAVIWLTYVLLYAVFHDLFFVWHSDLTTRLYGARDWLLYLMPYFIGRLVPATQKQMGRILKLILFTGLFVSIIGLIDYFVVPVGLHFALGVDKFYNDIYDQSWPTGLPYWTYIPGLGNTRRLTSFMFSGQNMALLLLVFLPVAVYNYRAHLTVWRRTMLGIAVVALLLTLARMTIFVGVIQSAIVLWLTGAQKRVLVGVYVVVLLLVMLFIGSATFRNYILDTITFREASAAVRPQQWTDGLTSLIQAPFGYGLGSSGTISQRLGTMILEGSESGYFKITGTIGIPGLLMWLLWFAGIIYYSYSVTRRKTGIPRGLAAVTFAIAIGIVVNNLTAPPDQSLFVIYIFPWLAGITVRVATRPNTRHKEHTVDLGQADSVEIARLVHNAN